MTTKLGLAARLQPVLFLFQVQDQVDALVRDIRGETEEARETRRRACAQLTDILAAYLPHTTVELFGSSASGKPPQEGGGEVGSRGGGPREGGAGSDPEGSRPRRRTRAFPVGKMKK